ncbi:hypothetical protein GALMADRAFT_207321 [Galerina marginata CBS 339.88]|uniref:Uncharacterized protein n=1 Tax=Galerina marginata (strain CBS 339.88) TaxID=685588 RepID=A0A067TI21_GALM3|nr:hypothetical protein GALMADRAFT_207321 [Galerina marginata CBS 339.88]
MAKAQPPHMQDHGDKQSVDVGHSKDSSVNYAEYISQGEGLDSVASVRPDGRISLNLDFKQDMPELHDVHAHSVDEFAVDKRDWKDCPNMNIVIMIVGSRGDVQPYVALGQQLLKDGHRVRIATHETFRTFVSDAGLEFFSIGGNPQDLMSYMVKNPGLMPGFESLTNGDIVRKRTMLNEMIDGCWNSCHSPCPITGRSFAADAIISNPPAFAHIHCAEALGIPLLLSFTMPWSPTAAFAHPLVNITNSNAKFGVNNYLSYAAADLLTWQGVGDIINNFRSTKLGLSPLSIRSGPGYVDRLKIPWTYCMSPALVPKPNDWKNYIGFFEDVTGFYFLDLATSYQPPADLVAFLSAGEAPVYIGFGSVVVDDPVALSETIFEATEKAGVRALVSSGWGGLGGASVPPHIFILGNVPHDWLFDHERVAAVVHHGGAGTTAIGLAKGRPTVVVPFFGDQAFWGSMIHKGGAGPEPIPYKELSVAKLKDAIEFAVSPAAKEAAKSLAQKIHDEASYNGVQKGVESFYKHLPLLNMRCDLDPSRVAVWWSKEQCLKLSAFAAQTLADAKLLSLRNLILHRSKEYGSHKEEPESMSIGGASATFWSLTHRTKIGGILHSAAGKADASYVAAHGIVGAMASVHDGLKHKRKDHEKMPRDTPDSEGSPKRKDTGTTVSSYEGMTGTFIDPGYKHEPKKDGLIGALKHLVHGSKRHAMDLVTMNVQGSWRLTETPSGKAEYIRQRLTRIAEGRKAVKHSTEAERKHIVERFNTEILHMPTRQQLYQDATERAKDASTGSDLDKLKTPDLGSQASLISSSTGTSSVASEGSTQQHSKSQTISGLDLVAPPLEGQDEADAFTREMELAMKLSLEEHESIHS